MEECDCTPLYRETWFILCCVVLLANPVLVSTFIIMGRPSEREGTRLELDL